MDEQISLFDGEIKPGTWVERHGRELTFDEIAGMVGEIIIIDVSTKSHEWFKAVRVERIAERDGSRRLIYYDGYRQRGLVDEKYFLLPKKSAKAYLPE